MTKIIILAAGKGTRMGSELPKALVPLNGRPLISYLAESVMESGVDDSPIVVVSPENREIISSELSQYNFQYAIQNEQLGTGHAVACAKSLIPQACDNVIVLYCDHPFIKAESIRQVAKAQTEAVTVMPAELGNYNDWHFNFYRWGRIIRNGKRMVEKIVEFKDANEEELKVTEVNPGFMCFSNKWLFENIEKLKNDNKQGEYYLTSLVGVAFSQNYEIGTIVIGAKEAMGVNSQAELLIAESINL